MVGLHKSSLFSHTSQVIVPFPSSAGKNLPLPEENSDLHVSILSIWDSFNGHEIEQTPVATRFQAHLFESC